jgi:hypothetical protein
MPALPVLVFLVFLILKVTHHIAWSWWLVCSPLLVLGGLTVITLLFVGGIFHKVGKNL